MGLYCPTLTAFCLGFMSYRIEAFKTLVSSPLTKRDITMVWPALPQSTILVQSLTFPTEDLATVTVPHRGVDIELPTHVFKPGDWSFEIPDSVFTTVRYEIERAFYERKMHTITLIMGNMLDVLGTDGALNSLARVGSMTSASLLTAVQLEKAFIKGIDPAQFSKTSSATEAIVWNVKVHYTYISKLSPLG